VRLTIRPVRARHLCDLTRGEAEEDSSEDPLSNLFSQLVDSMNAQRAAPKEGSCGQEDKTVVWLQRRRDESPAAFLSSLRSDPSLGKSEYIYRVVRS
jgi:hypothetical protein